MHIILNFKADYRYPSEVPHRSSVASDFDMSRRPCKGRGNS